jgi:nicotinamide-nucleotide amidase
MHAEVIAIGSELTSGAKLDTNSQWLSLELAAIGITVTQHATVSDDMAEMLAACRGAVARADVVIITGGLGPTLDDLVRQCLADLTETELVLHEPSLEHVRSIFDRRGIQMPERNVIQAMFPANSEPIPNPRGTAPGIWMELPRDGTQSPCRLAALPGVPSEMKPMFLDWVLPRLPHGSAVIRHALINCFGSGESAIEEQLDDLTTRGREPEVGITAHNATITLRIKACGSSVSECDEKIASTTKTIHDRLGDLVFGHGDERLQEIVVRQLVEKGQTLSTVEVGVGGVLTQRLADVPGHDDCHRVGLVLADGATFEEAWRANATAFEAAAATHPDMSVAWAIQCRKYFRTDWALALVKGPPLDGASSSLPIVHVALVGKDTTQTRDMKPAGNPAIVRSRTAKTALNMLRLQLLEEAAPPEQC